MPAKVCEQQGTQMTILETHICPLHVVTARNCSQPQVHLKNTSIHTMSTCTSASHATRAFTSRENSQHTDESILQTKA